MHHFNLLYNLYLDDTMGRYYFYISIPSIPYNNQKSYFNSFCHNSNSISGSAVISTQVGAGNQNIDILQSSALERTPIELTFTFESVCDKLSSLLVILPLHLRACSFYYFSIHCIQLLFTSIDDEC